MLSRVFFRRLSTTRPTAAESKFSPLQTAIRDQQKAKIFVSIITMYNYTHYTNILICFVKYTRYSISGKAIFKSDLYGYVHLIHYIKLMKLIKDGALRFKVN